MKLLAILAFIMGSGYMANAETVYYVNGKASTIRQAQKAPDSAKILKVQVNFVSINPSSGRFKKISGSSASVSNIPR